MSSPLLGLNKTSSPGHSGLPTVAPTAMPGSAKAVATATADTTHHTGLNSITAVSPCQAVCRVKHSHPRRNCGGHGVRGYKSGIKKFQKCCKFP
jgi:hypothetical protein